MSTTHPSADGEHTHTSIEDDVVDPAHIDNLSHETRRFAPSPTFADAAFAKADMYEDAESDRLNFWSRQAERLSWTKRLDHI